MISWMLLPVDPTPEMTSASGLPREQAIEVWEKMCQAAPPSKLPATVRDQLVERLELLVTVGQRMVENASLKETHRQLIENIKREILELVV